MSAGLVPQFVVLFGAASIVKGCVGQGYRTVPHEYQYRVVCWAMRRFLHHVIGEEK